MEFDPPVREEYAGAIVDEWLKLKSKPAAEAYFSRVAPGEFIFARTYVKARMISKGKVLDDVWSAGNKLPMYDLEFDRIADLIDRIGGYGTNLQVFIIRIEIAYTTLPKVIRGKKASAKPTKRRVTRRKAARGI